MTAKRQSRSRWIIVFLLIIFAALIGFLVYAHQPKIKPIPTGSLPQFDAELVEHGRVMSAAGYCASCHTEKGGVPYTGNYAIVSGFGTIYSTNITPDTEQGIGLWSEEAFIRAMRKGVDREGRHLFPAFPYNHFAKMSDDDIRAVYAYIMTEVEPAKAVQKENELPFPLNLRVLQAGWKLVSVDLGRYEPDSDQSELWNRGAYLVEGVTHCGACHTPRNIIGAEKASEQFEGAAIDQWIAPALTAANAASVYWSAAEYSDYLKTGATREHGIAAGPMGPVVHAGLRELPDRDLEAIGVYLADKAGTTDGEDSTSEIIAASLQKGSPKKTYRWNQGERLYATACASCHYNVEQIALGRPDLGINSATHINEPDNLIHVMLDGVDNKTGIAGVVMPGFRFALNDEEIASIAAYLRATRTDSDAWPDLTERVATIRKESASPQ